MKTTFSRNLFTYTMILVLALVLVGISFQYLVRDYLTNRAVDVLKNDGAVIAQVAAAYQTEPGVTNRDFLTNLSVASKVSQADAVICDSNGMLIMCSDAPLGCDHQGTVLSNPDYLEKIQSREYVVTEGVVKGLYTDKRYVVSTAIRDSAGHCLGFVMVSTPTSSTEAILSRLTETYVFVSLMVVLTAVLTMIYYARKASRPLRVIADAANAFGHGDFSARVKVSDRSPEEIRELGLAFNNMAVSLEKSEYQRKEFVANVSHELKTPMTTIGGYVDGVLDGTIPEEKQAQYLQLVSDETKRLSRLVRSMLDISQLGDQPMGEESKLRFDVGECAGQVLISFEKKINDKELEVLVDIPEYPVYSFANRDAITQVIYNLTDNAVKFCPHGGELGMRIYPGTNKLYISVSNSGPAIPPAELPLVFDRFHKLDKSRSQNRDGWGLGLYIVKTIVCSHGEDISVSSRDGKTEFTFTLPMVN